MTWPLFAVMALVSVGAALWLRAKGLASIGLELPSGFGTHHVTVHTTGLRPQITLMLPTTTQGSGFKVGNAVVAPQPYFISMTLDGEPVDVSQALPGVGITLNLTKPQGQIVAVYKESVAFGVLDLQSAAPDTTAIIAYGP